MNNIAIIPARGGSKRIPKKNIKEFLGKPIIAYSIEAALNSGLFEEVMVSTDSIEIAEVAQSYGAKVPFIRSEQNSNDTASTFDVIYEVISCYKRINNKFDNLCCLYPTAPFVKNEILIEAYILLHEKNFDSVLPVVAYSYPPLRGLKVSDGRAQMVWPEYIDYRSQELESIYHDTGQFYMAKTDIILKKKSIWTDNTGAIIISEMQAQDIDNEMDWKLAEIKYSLVNGIL